MANKKMPAIHHLSRSGEGGRIKTNRTLIGVPDANGGQVVTLTLDLSDAEVPARHYSADRAWVKFDSDMVRLYFGQLDGLGEGLESVVVIRMSFLGVAQFLESVAGIEEGLRRLLVELKVGPLRDEPLKAKPPQTVTMDANIVAVAYSGRDACMDFYYSSPHVMASVQKGGEYRASPQVRVILTTQRLLTVIDGLMEHQNAMPADIRKESLS